MTLASRRLPLAALAFAIVASARTAAAQMPPPDFPPLPMLPGGAPAAPVAPSAAPVAPGRPVTPPVAPPLPYGYGYPYGYGAPPPGYGQPGSYPYATPSPYPRAESDPNAIPPPPPRRRYDNGLFAGGVIAVLGGMTSVLIGAYLVSSGADRIEIYCDTPPSTPCAHKNDAPRMTAGALMMGLGAAVGAAGLPMWFIGSRYVTITGEEKKQALRPEVRIGAGSASVSLRF